MLLYKRKYKKLFSFAPFVWKVISKKVQINFWFSGFSNSLLKHKKVSNLAARKFHPPKYKVFFQTRFFCFLFFVFFVFFWAWKVLFPEYKKSFKVFVSWNIRNFWRVLVSPNISKTFFWENIRNFFEVFVSWNIRAALFRDNIRNFLILDLESSIFKYMKLSQGGFFQFLSLGWKVRQIAPYCTTIWAKIWLF